MGLTILLLHTDYLLRELFKFKKSLAVSLYPFLFTIDSELLTVE